jgi:hypothetical protein
MGDGTVLCPSAQPDMPGSMILGIVQGTVEQPRMIHLAHPQPGTPESFGSMAIARRAGLDLRNNLKFTSCGHLNVLRVEVMQLLDEAFRFLPPKL